MKYLLTVAWLGLISSVAAADVVILTNGGRLTGMARREGDRVVIELKSGTVSIAASDVERIEPGRTPLHEYEERYARALATGKAADSFELALWCRKEGITRHLQFLLLRVIRLEPDHEGARRMLGHVFHDGRWMTSEEHRKALGFVEFRGRWMMSGERLRILAADVATRAAVREKRIAAARIATRPELVYTLGLPAYPPRGGRGSSAGGWYPYGYYGYWSGHVGDGWGYHWSGPHVGYHGGRGHGAGFAGGVK